MPLLHRRCTACERTFNLLSAQRGGTFERRRGRWSRVGGEEVLTATEGDDETFLGCPGCGGLEVEALVGGAVGVELGGAGGAGRFYPYFDPQLGRQIDSAQHRRQVCKELGLVPMEGGMEGAVEEKIRSDNAHNERSEREWAEYQAHCADDPEIRRVQDRMRGATTPDEVRKAFYGR